MFYYDNKQYNIKNGDNIDIRCHYDGDDCIFSITPELPPTVSFDDKSGRIYGIWDNKYHSTYYITCKNSTNIINTEISIRYDDITYFSYGEYYFKFNKNEYFKLQPTTDGENVKYYIEGELPESIKIDEMSGIIHGCYGESKSLIIIAYCRNNYSRKSFQFTIEFI